MTSLSSNPEEHCHHLCMSPSKAPLCSLAVGMKVEAVDRKYPTLICVATITYVRPDSITVHFDGWDGPKYDYDCDLENGDVQPPGTCERAGFHQLTAPKGMTDFSWDSYLTSTGAIPAPAGAFRCTSVFPSWNSKGAPAGFQGFEGLDGSTGVCHAPLLTSFDLEGVAEYIASGRARNINVVTRVYTIIAFML